MAMTSAHERNAVRIQSENRSSHAFLAKEKNVLIPSIPVVPHGATKTILIVDDEEYFVRTTKLLLEAMGYDVLTALAGGEAIDVFRQNRQRVSLVILDLTMPEIGGAQIFRCLREIEPDIKVLLLSGYSIEGRATELLERGCNGFIQKPFNVATLTSRLKELLWAMP
jgi:two-component system, cell cycle sensor histidine kinase and response regulator CckA